MVREASGETNEFIRWEMSYVDALIWEKVYWFSYYAPDKGLPLKRVFASGKVSVRKYFR